MTRTTIDIDDERFLTIALIIDTKTCENILPILSSNIFKTPYSRQTFKWIEEWFKENGEAPGSKIKDIYLQKKNELTEEYQKSISIFLKSISDEYETKDKYNSETAITSLKKYIEKRRLENVKDAIDDASEREDFDEVSKQVTKGLLLQENKIVEKGHLFTFISDVEVKPPNWIVKDFIENESMSMFFGETGSYKTFLALDLGLCVASGKAWHKKEIKDPGTVLYIAGEGKSGISRRCLAWSIENNIPLDNIPFASLNPKIQLSDEDNIKLLESAIKQLIAERGKLKLLILDTWARVSGIEENSNSDTSKVIAELDKLKEKYGFSVLVIHHNGLGDKDRGRGASSLKCALDNEFKISKDKDNTIKLESTKLKENPSDIAMFFEMIDIDLGFNDEDGNMVRKGTIRSNTEKVFDGEARKMLREGKNEKKLKNYLKLLLSEKEKVTRDELDEAVIESIPDSSIRWQTFQRCIKKGTIKLEGDFLNLGH